MTGIYKITSPSGKVYVGQSTDIDRRKRAYKKYIYSIKDQTILYRSINKYGWENHDFEVLEECEVKELNERERYWQEELESVGENGLNCRYTKTKDKSGYHSRESRKRMSESAKGRTFSEEQLKKFSESAKKSYSRRVKVVNTDTGEEYSSMKEAAESVDMKYTTLVAQLKDQNPNKTSLILKPNEDE